jgi:hypothetical protein
MKAKLFKSFDSLDIERAIALVSTYGQIKEVHYSTCVVDNQVFYSVLITYN